MDHADGGEGLVARVAENLWESTYPGVNALAVVLQQMVHWISGRQDRCVRGAGEHDRGIGLPEQHPAAGETIEVRSSRRSVAVGADAVGAEGVESEEDYIARLRGWGRHACRRQGDQLSRKEDEDRHRSGGQQRPAK